jgi:glycine/D-amino acid oxidase-like deaminating enzyme
MSINGINLMPTFHSTGTLAVPYLFLPCITPDVNYSANKALVYEMPMKYDLIIIGSGSVGSAAGYYATQAGLNVLMIDAHLPPHSEGSHHGDTRLIRHAYGEGERYVPLVLRAQTLWDELAKLTEERVFDRTGVINLGPAHSAFLATVEHSAREFNLDVESWTPKPS